MIAFQDEHGRDHAGIDEFLERDGQECGGQQDLNERAPKLVEEDD